MGDLVLRFLFNLLCSKDSKGEYTWDWDKLRLAWACIDLHTFLFLHLHETGLKMNPRQSDFISIRWTETSNFRTFIPYEVLLYPLGGIYIRPGWTQMSMNSYHPPHIFFLAFTRDRSENGLDRQVTTYRSEFYSSHVNGGKSQTTFGSSLHAFQFWVIIFAVS